MTDGAAPTSPSPSPRDDLRAAEQTLEPVVAELGIGDRHRRADRQGLDRRRRDALAPGRRGQGLRGARRRGDQHRDDLHLADQDLLRDPRRPRARGGPGAARAPSSSEPATGGPRGAPDRAGGRDERAGTAVAVVGATGAVGTMMLAVLARARVPARRDRPVRLRALRRPRADRRLSAVEALNDDADLDGIDIALFSAGGGTSRAVGAALRRGRRDRDRQLLRSGATRTCRWSSPRSTRTRSSGHRGLIANPNCSTMQLMIALAPIHRAAGIERLIVSTYQSVSGTGQKALEELRRAGRADLAAAARNAGRRRSIPQQIAFNVIGAAGSSPTAMTTPTRSAR